MLTFLVSQSLVKTGINKPGDETEKKKKTQ